MSTENKKVHLEIEKTRRPIPENFELNKRILDYLKKTEPTNNATSQILELNQENCPELYSFVQSIAFDGNLDDTILADQNNFVFDYFQPNERPSEVETFQNDSDGYGEEIPASNHWILPSKEFIGLWQHLIYEDGLKENIINFIETSILFAKHNVNQHIISCNRIVLLHGPPGTGKTSLCKAIAQKLSIRLKNTYKFTHLVEINSHSLFSKWFSESGKLVMKLFSKIREMISLPNSLVCVLVDEIESLAYSRDTVSGNEPKDALRVVNAVLTQLDQIKNYPNVLILATSNLTSSIDIAFIDRADIKQFVGNPSEKAIFEIYLSAVKELSRVKLIDSDDLKWIEFNSSTFLESPINSNQKNINYIYELLDIARKSCGLSGRTLRKLPFLAFSSCCRGSSTITIKDFLKALNLTVDKEIENIKMLVKN